MIKNWVKQKCTTTGIGPLLLGDSVEGFINFSSAYLDGERVYYSILDGSDRENGIGIYITASNTIQRDLALETLVAGSFSNVTPAFLDLTGNAFVMVTPTSHILTTNIPVWDDVECSLMLDSALGYTAPGAVPLSGGVNVLAFDPAVQESLGFSFKIPHSIQLGSPMYPFIRWSPSDTSTGTVRWGIELTAAARGGVFSDVLGTFYVEQAGGAVANAHQLIEFTNAIVNSEPDTIITGRVFRDAANGNDTYSADALFHSLSLHVLKDRVGTPKRDPDFYSWV